MNKGDQLVDRAADRLRDLADRAAAEGGMAAMFAEALAEDAAFLRQLKPSLIKARAKGEAPTDLPAGSSAPALPLMPQAPKQQTEGPNPLLVVGAALVIGIALAKLIDWRSHAHPRD
ncbi:MAG TPA: hypothetical protein VFG93_10730 [Gaiellaceae bacterium]|nr:hypothetical protein [Gaiellaceae bacterium]